MGRFVIAQEIIVRVIDSVWVVEISNYIFGIVPREYFASFDCYIKKRNISFFALLTSYQKTKGMRENRE